MKYEWLLFDLDNTLLDFDASEHYALEQVLKSVGIGMQKKHLEVYEKINKECWGAFEAGKLVQSVINETRFSQFLQAIGLGDENAIEFGNYFLDRLSEKAVYIKGAKELLEEQYKKYQLAIVTNGLKKVQRPKLVKNKVAHFFKVIVVSDEIGVSKPNAAFFDYAFQEMQFPKKEKVLIIGDSLNSDILGGLNYGIDTCWYNSNGIQNASRIKPTYEINRLAELKEFRII